MIRFGFKSIVLLLGAVHGLVVLCLLLFVGKNKAANRVLAALLLVFVLRLTPYIIGFAGYYVAYPWLSFAPLDISFAFGPLVYLYVKLLTEGSASRRTYALLLPAMVQTLYYLAIFLQPLVFKNHWDDVVQEPWINPIEISITLILLTVGWLASIRQFRSYRRWVNQNVSNGEDLRLDWIRYFLIALGTTLTLWIALAITQYFIKPLNYYQRFPFYVWQMLLVYYLGFEGWRNASRHYPHPANATFGLGSPAESDVESKVTSEPDAVSLAPNPLLQPSPPTPNRDWTAQAIEWRQAVLDQSLWRDPGITLSTLSRQLGTNTTHLSRALNEGLGQNFNEFINRLRVESVAQQLSSDPGTDGRDLLELAFQAGFSSKASFNRSFKLYTGVTPTEFRRNPTPIQPSSSLKS